MGLKPVSKEDRDRTRAEEKAALQAAIAATGKPPEKSAFTKRRWLWVGTIAAAGIITATAMTIASQKKKDGSK